MLSALASKRHVLCERPLSLTSRGVERILTAAARAERTVTVANNHRYRTDVQTLSRFIQGGELGKIVGVRAGAYQFKRPAEGWRYRRAESGGGAFLDHGVPLLDLALWLADYPDPVRVTAHMDRGRGASAVEEAMVVQLECAGGQSFLFDVSSAYVGEEERWWFEVLAARGSARLAPLRVVKELNGRATNVSPSGAAGRESAFIQSYRAELAHFLAVVRGETDVRGADRSGRRCTGSSRRSTSRPRKGRKFASSRVRRASDRSHRDARCLERAAQSLRELRGVRTVAVDADRVDACMRDVVAVDRSRPFRRAPCESRVAPLHRRRGPARRDVCARRASRRSCSCDRRTLRPPSSVPPPRLR